MPSNAIILNFKSIKNELKVWTGVNVNLAISNNSYKICENHVHHQNLQLDVIFPYRMKKCDILSISYVTAK